jgi:hypothetical protein
MKRETAVWLLKKTTEDEKRIETTLDNLLWLEDMTGYECPEISEAIKVLQTL